jgi:hypothetical protein
MCGLQQRQIKSISLCLLALCLHIYTYGVVDADQLGLGRLRRSESTGSGPEGAISYSSKFKSRNVQHAFNITEASFNDEWGGPRRSRVSRGLRRGRKLEAKKSNQSKKSKTKSKSPNKVVCLCPKDPGADGNPWNAELTVDLIGAPGKLRNARKMFYLDQLKGQLEEALDLKCPESKVSIDDIVITGQTYFSEDNGSYNYGSYNYGRQRRNLARGTTTIDHYVAVSYRLPPQRPNFSRLFIPAIDSEGTARRRRDLLSMQDLVSRHNSVEEENGSNGTQQITSLQDFIAPQSSMPSTLTPSGSSQEGLTVHQVASRLSQNWQYDAYSDHTSNDSSNNNQTCEPRSSFLERLQSKNDDYFLEVEAIESFIMQVQSSYSYSYGSRLLEGDEEFESVFWWR